MEKDSAKRLKSVIDFLDTNPHSFALSLGFKRSQGIYDVLNGKVGISGKLATKIIGEYPQFSLAWLQTGTGEMLSKPVSEKQVMDMAESTVKQLQKELGLAYKLIEQLEKENARLVEQIKKAR